ncbi:MAG: N-acetylmuramoyl-L-alanine amidase [Clostridia bacterium]|nr:N-acetylmuramoyl-L-alanine amidase [Clostridia bacterium]
MFTRKRKFYTPFLSVILILVLFVVMSSSNIINIHRTTSSSTNSPSASYQRPNTNPGISVSRGTDPYENRQAFKNKLVVIDPGHGGDDSGADANGLLEKDIVLDISFRLNTILQRSGISTYLTRTEDKFIGINDRFRAANSKNASIIISIHCDWFDDTSHNGTSTLYYTSSNKQTGKLNDKEYAQIIQDELVKILGTSNRGILRRTDLGVLKYSKMPSALAELGFLSNKHDAELLASDSFRQKAALGLSRGIKKALINLE